MNYSFKEFTIKELVELIDKDLIDLNPDYQRNYIWSPNDQKSLIDTILNNYPLPSFFLYFNNGKYEMVDGQQRSKTIYRFIKGLLKSSKGKFFSDSDTEDIFSYRLPIILIENLSSKDNLKDFYVLINKKGVHLNVPEVTKAEHQDKFFLKLANEMLDYQNFIDLDLFTDAAIKRMNDRAYVEELLGYLKLGVKEKKSSVKEVYNEDIDNDEYQTLKIKFCSNIDKIAKFNTIKPINNTRYKQKNDFYTLFSFINENENINQNVLNYHYSILLILDRKDNEGKQFISPTNEESIELREYAINCVSQSNSKNARDKRLLFFNSILKNKKIEDNEILANVLNFLSNIYGEDKIRLKDIDGLQLLDIELLK